MTLSRKNPIGTPYGIFRGIPGGNLRETPREISTKLSNKILDNVEKKNPGETIGGIS